MKEIAVIKSAIPALWYGLFISLVVLSACSSSEEKVDTTYRQAQTMPELQVPQGLEMPAGGRSISDIPEELDTGEIPKNLDQPPLVAGLNLAQDEAKAAAQSDDEQAPGKKSLQSEIIFNSDNTQLLAVKADIDTVWPQVAKALEKMGFTIDDSNRGKFYYSISRQFERLKTVHDPSQPVELGLETPKEEHFIYVEPGEVNTEITVRNAQSQVVGTVVANQLLQQIKTLLE